MRNIIFPTLTLLLLLSVGIPMTAGETISHGATILPNGFVGEGEWEGPGVVKAELGEKVAMYLRRDSQYIFIGVHSTDTQHTGIDLYVKANRSCAHRLHISSAHGQSENCDSVWTEMDYCENRLWTSNLVESIFIEGKTHYVAPEIFEYMIYKSLMPGETLKLMVHLKRPEKIVPSGATPDSVDSWHTIGLP